MDNHEFVGQELIPFFHASKHLHAQRINGEDVQRLKGNVLFRQNDVTMSCDSAILYSIRNVLNAYGQVVINQNDSVHLYGNYLEYDGKTKYAVIRQNVRMTDKQMTLVTQQLDYDFAKKQAFYNSGGNIVDGENRLTSKIGYYFSETRDMYFKKNVVLTNPQFVMKCDTLQYNISTRKAIFHGPTKITSEKNLIYCETGWYNTETNKSQFGKNAYLSSENQLLWGDSLFYDRTLGFGKAVNNVRVLDSVENLFIEGHYAEYDQKRKKTFITNSVLVTKRFKDDTLFMNADTIRTLYDSTGKYRIIKGYYKAKVYNKQFQALGDSMIYSGVDSTIDLRTKPVMWFGAYQATAKRILMHTKNNKIERADLFQEAFLANEEDSIRYSQIKGRDMIAYFRNSEMYQIDVNGNSEAMYYVKDDKKAYIGLNKIVSSDIKIYIREKKIHRINFIKDPDGQLVPMKDANPMESKLPGFIWHGKERPLSVNDIKRPKEEKPVVVTPVKKTVPKKAKKKKT